MPDATTTDENKAYEAYQKAGVHNGTPLDQAAFSQLWRDISPDDRRFFEEQFRAGEPTGLSMEFVRDIGEATVDQATIDLAADRFKRLGPENEK